MNRDAPARGGRYPSSPRRRRSSRPSRSRCRRRKASARAAADDRVSRFPQTNSVAVRASNRPTCAWERRFGGREHI